MPKIELPPVALKPNLWPRSIFDCALVLLVAPVQLIGLFLIPAFVTYIVFGSTNAALFSFAAIYGVFVAFSVWSITLSSEGVQFKRIWGYPKKLPWTAITSIELAPRWEVVRKGWLWPLLPAREMTTSFSSSGHYRFSWQGGFCYFPPAKADVLEKYVSHYLEHTPES